MKSYNNQHKNDDDNVKTSNKTGEIALRCSLNYYYHYHYIPSVVPSLRFGQKTVKEKTKHEKQLQKIVIFS